MRITAFRSWFNATIHQSVGAARRMGHAISRRVRDATGKVDAGVGVGDDESSFGGGRGSRAWIEILEEAVRRFRELFEKSKFERRYVRVESFLRKLLGLPPKVKEAPSLPAPKKRVGPALKAPPPVSAEQAARMRQQIQMGMVQANTARNAAIRDAVTKSSKPKLEGITRDPEEEDPED